MTMQICMIPYCVWPSRRRYRKFQSQSGLITFVMNLCIFLSMPADQTRSGFAIASDVTFHRALPRAHIFPRASESKVCTRITHSRTVAALHAYTRAHRTSQLHAAIELVLRSAHTRTARDAVRRFVRQRAAPHRAMQRAKSTIFRMNCMHFFPIS